MKVTADLLKGANVEIDKFRTKTNASLYLKAEKVTLVFQLNKPTKNDPKDYSSIPDTIVTSFLCNYLLAMCIYRWKNVPERVRIIHFQHT